MIFLRASICTGGLLVTAALTSCVSLPIENSVWQQIATSVAMPESAPPSNCVATYPILPDVRRLLLSPNVQIYRYSLSLSSEEREMQFDVKIDQVFLSVKSLIRGDKCLSFMVNFVSSK